MLFDPGTLLLLLLAILPRGLFRRGWPAFYRWRRPVLLAGFAGVGVLVATLGGAGRVFIQLPLIPAIFALFAEFMHQYGEAGRGAPTRRWAALTGMATLATSLVLGVAFTIGQVGDTAHFWFLDLFNKGFDATLTPLLAALGAEEASGFVLTYLNDPLRFLSQALIGIHFLATILMFLVAYRVLAPLTPGLAAPAPLSRDPIPRPFAVLLALTFVVRLALPDQEVAIIAFKLPAALFVWRGATVLLQLGARFPLGAVLAGAALVVAMLHPWLVWGLGGLALAECLLGASASARDDTLGAAESGGPMALAAHAMRHPWGRAAIVLTMIVPITFVPDLIGGGTYQLPTRSARADEPATPPEAPDGMVAVQTARGSWVLIDRFEHPNREGATPTIGATPDEAQALCEAEGKQLCSDREWLAACSHGGRRVYLLQDPDVEAAPASHAADGEEAAGGGARLGPRPGREGSTRRRGRRGGGAGRDGLFVPDEALSASRLAVKAKCNVGEPWDHDGLSPSGAKPECVSPDGVADLTGNAWEWVRMKGQRRDKSGFWALAGAYYAYDDDQTMACPFRVKLHPAQLPIVESEAIGFRCCKEP